MSGPGVIPGRGTELESEGELAGGGGKTGETGLGALFVLLGPVPLPIARAMRLAKRCREGFIRFPSSARPSPSLMQSFLPVLSFPPSELFLFFSASSLPFLPLVFRGLAGALPMIPKAVRGTEPKPKPYPIVLSTAVEVGVGFLLVLD